MIARFFIDRPIFATVLSVLITLVGLISLSSLPVAQYPRITPPGVVISISYPGASAQVVADTVAAPIEQQVNGVENMLYMSSQSGNDGSYSLTVTFDIGTDLKTSLVKVQNRVTLAMPQLPTEVQNQGITIRKKTPDQLMIVNFYSKNGTYSDLDLSNYATIYVKDELLRVDGVSDITYQGERDYSIRVWMDPQKLAAHNLTAIDVANAISAQNLDAPAGQIGGSPAKSYVSKQLTIDTLGRLKTPEQFGNIIVAANLGRPGPANNGTTLPASNASGATSNTPLIAPVGITGGTPDIDSASSDPTVATSIVGPTSGLPDTSASTTVSARRTTVTTDATTLDVTTNAASAGLPSTTTPSTTTTTAPTVIPGGSGKTGAITPSTAIVRVRDIVTSTWKDGRLVPRVELGALNYTLSCTFDGYPSVGLNLYQLPGTNALDVGKRVRARMEELKKRFPVGVDYDIGYDTTPFIEESVNDVFMTLFEAVVLVGIVVLVFLQDWRAMVLPMIDVPVSIIGTFTVMAMLGFSLNNISLFGLVLAIGIVVDDAIVVLENIERFVAKGFDARTATIKAMGEVTGPIVAVSLVLCAVFVPCAFLGGITGQFFRQFAVTISVSTVISAINAITMTPSRAVMIFKGHEGQGHDIKREALPWWSFAVLTGVLAAVQGKSWAFEKMGIANADELSKTEYWGLLSSIFAVGAIPGGLVGWLIIRPVNAVLGSFFKAFNRAFDGVTAVYGWVVGGSMRVSWLVLVVYGCLLLLTYALYAGTPTDLMESVGVPANIVNAVRYEGAPTGFIPEQDQGRLIVNIQLPDSASLERTMETAHQVEAITLHTPGVRHVVTFSGISFLLQANSPNFASMFVVLDSFADRNSKPNQGQRAIMKTLSTQWSNEVMDARVDIYPASPVPGIGTAGGYKVMVEDQGNLGVKALESETTNLARELNKQPGLTNGRTLFRARTPMLYLDIDRVKVAKLGLSLDDVNNTLDMNLGSLYVNNYNDFGRDWQVTIQADGVFRDDISKLNMLAVRNNTGSMVQMTTLMNTWPPQQQGGPIAITRYNLYQAAAINGNISNGTSTGEAIDMINKVAEVTLPHAMHKEWTELMFLQIQAGNKGFAMFLLGIVFVFLALAALYESWTLPLAVILVVPLCVLCSVIGVLITNRDVNIFVQIGLVVLVGLACKNAILIVEYARQLHLEGGRSIYEATLQASRLRLRPILMTSLAFIFGVVPLMVASGAGAEMRRSLGTAVFSGMLGVTLFGIFLTPVFFFVIQRVGETKVFARPWVQWAVSFLFGVACGLIIGYEMFQLGIGSLTLDLELGAGLFSSLAVAVRGLHLTFRGVQARKIAGQAGGPRP